MLRFVMKAKDPSRGIVLVDAWAWAATAAFTDEEHVY